MKNVLLQVKRDAQRMFLEFRDPSNGQLVVTAEVDWTSVGDAISKGGIDRYPADARLVMHEQISTEPIHTEHRTHLIECPGLPERDEAAKARAIVEVLRPYEIEGWKALPNQLGNRAKIKRTLPGGLELYEVEFVRHQYATPPITTADVRAGYGQEPQA